MRDSVFKVVNCFNFTYICGMDKKKYTPLNLPVELVLELKDMRIETSTSTGKNITFEALIREMIDCRRKYAQLGLSIGVIQELSFWREAYSNTKGAEVSFEEMIKDMIACNRRFKWWRNTGRDIITEYKACRLAEAKGISKSMAKKMVIENDNDPTTSSRGQNGFLSDAYNMHSEYVWDKDWRDLV